MANSPFFLDVFRFPVLYFREIPQDGGGGSIDSKPVNRPEIVRNILFYTLHIFPTHYVTRRFFQAKQKHLTVYDVGQAMYLLAPQGFDKRQH